MSHGLRPEAAVVTSILCHFVKKATMLSSVMLGRRDALSGRPHGLNNTKDEVAAYRARALAMLFMTSGDSLADMLHAAMTLSPTSTTGASVVAEHTQHAQGLMADLTMTHERAARELLLPFWAAATEDTEAVKGKEDAEGAIQEDFIRVFSELVALAAQEEALLKAFEAYTCPSPSSARKAVQEQLYAMVKAQYDAAPRL
jgi:hypothetical protein